MSDAGDRVIEVPPDIRAAGQARDHLQAAEQALPRRRFFSDMPDKGLFAAVAVVGFVGIMVLKVYTILNAGLVAALAVSIMIAYGFFSFQLPAIQMRPDRLGDNFYYLGFIYTLASLSAALMELQYSPKIENLLGNFGIALVTTIVGVAGRVLFVQMRGDIDDVEEHVRRDLVAASADLRGQLSLALREFETFYAGILQATDEVTEKSAERLERQMGEIGTVAEAAVKRVDAAGNANQARSEELAELVKIKIEQIGTVAEAAIEKINASAMNNVERTEGLAELLGKLTQALSELPALSQVQLPNERLQNQLSAFSGELAALIVELRETVSKTRKRTIKSQRKWFWPFGATSAK